MILTYKLVVVKRCRWWVH